MRYKQTRKKIRQVGKELGVRYVVMGAALWSGNRVRISVQLIDVTDESQVWAETYERRLDDIFVFLREVCQDIARKIEVKLAPHEQARLDYLVPVKPEAYKNYLNGRYLWNKRTPKSLQQSTLLFEKAIALDPKSDEAYLWLGLAQRKANRNGDARKAFSKSLELNPNRVWTRQQLEKTPPN